MDDETLAPEEETPEEAASWILTRNPKMRELDEWFVAWRDHAMEVRLSNR